MTDIVLVFEVHQPFRLRKDFFWENRMFKRLRKNELFEYYFEDDANKEIFQRAAKKCYFPSNKILLDVIDKHKRERKPAKVAFSVSGTFLDQCERYDRDVLETFRQLAKTHRVEFLEQTYYHSLAGLYPDRTEFKEQVKEHAQATKDLLGVTPRVFENTELLYNNAVAKAVEDLGYKGIFTEGVERILHGRSANYLYTPKNCKKLKVLLRNYKLTDDIGFRFSAQWWSEWPLTADKYASWLAATPGNAITVFPDYETFGEHHWPETGIHDFLKFLPDEILKWTSLHMATPSEAIEKHASAGEIDVPELGGTVSWADIERDASCWLGNTMQWAYYTTLRKLEPVVKETQDTTLLRLWRLFQTSDHLYYMFTAGGAPGEVHSYFSSFNTPTDAFVTAQAAILDFESRVRLTAVGANEPFIFYKGKGEDQQTGTKVSSLDGMINAVRTVPAKCLEFHNGNLDFEKWARESLRDDKLADELRITHESKPRGEPLRKALLKSMDKRLEGLRAKTEEGTGYF